MLKLKDLTMLPYPASLSSLPEGKKILVNTINAHSYNVAQNDERFAESLRDCDVLIPDGVGVVIGVKLLTGIRIKRTAGNDLFWHVMGKLNKTGGTAFFLGSSEETLSKVREIASVTHPNVKIKTYSPPYKAAFTKEDNQAMIEAVNAANPDALWIGMTAPKQEKWAFEHYSELNVNGVIGCIGAVFDFYAGNIKRAPRLYMKFGMEWLYRFLSEPRRLWRRYLLGNMLFFWNLRKESRNNTPSDPAIGMA